MCDRGNVEEIVHEMLLYLEMADYSIREEMVKRRTIFDTYLICAFMSDHSPEKSKTVCEVENGPGISYWNWVIWPNIVLCTPTHRCTAI